MTTKARVSMARSQTLNEAIASQVILRASQVQRFSGDVQQRALAELMRLDQMLVGIIAQAGPSKKLRSLLKEAREVIKDHVDRAAFQELRDTEALIRAEAAATAGTINTAVGGPLATAPSSAAFVEATRRKALVMGAPAKEWWSRQSARTFQRFSDTIRTGVLLGRDTATLTREWTAQSTQLRRHAEAQVRTGVQSVANASRLETLRSNADVVESVVAVATLDTRTSHICMARDGQVWALDDPSFPGPPPWHWNCRTTLAPVLKGFDQLSDRNQRNVPQQMRASMNGQVPRNMTYAEWLRTLPEADQIEALGRKRWELWKSGTSLKDMVRDNRTLTLAELT